MSNFTQRINTFVDEAALATYNTVEAIKGIGYGGAAKLGMLAVTFTGTAAYLQSPERADAAPAQIIEEDTEVAETTQAEKDAQAVKNAITQNSAKLQEKGAYVGAADAVAKQEVDVFLGADRGEIVGELPNGACIIATQEGKTVEEFTKTEMAVGQTPEEAKANFVKGFCNGENGVNVPAVATYMATIEAMKNNIDINGEYNKVYTEMTKKYLDAMRNDPDLAQAYLQTVEGFFGNATFGEVRDIAGTTDTSIYTNEKGEIVTLTVTNRDGAVDVEMELKTINKDGKRVTQKIRGKRCNQTVPVKVEAPAPTPEAPAEPAQPLRRPTTPERTPTTVVERFTHELEVCVDLDENGDFVFQTVSGEGSSEAEAVQNAQAEFNRLQAEHEGDCEVVATSTSTTTTTRPVTTTTLLVSTTSTTTTLPPTTVTVTVPDKITTTTIDQPDDPGPTTPEPTVPDDTRPPATVVSSDTTLPEQAAAAVIEGTAQVGGAVGDNPVEAGSALVGLGAFGRFVKRSRRKVRQNLGKVAVKS